MTLHSKFYRSLVDAALLVGLIVAVGVVHSVEGRLPHQAPGRIKESPAGKLETVQTPGPRTGVDKTEQTRTSDVALKETPRPRAEGGNAQEAPAGNVALKETKKPRDELKKVKEVPVANVAMKETKPPREDIANVNDVPKEGVVGGKDLAGTVMQPKPKASPPDLNTFVYRTKKDKSEWVGQYGGTPESEAAVQAGLNWLARHQAKEGFWSSECLTPRGSSPIAMCDPQGACTVPGMNYVMAQTGFALLALQASGNYECNREKYSENVRRGLNWLVLHQRRDGALVGPLSEGAGGFGHNFMYEHAIATFALTESVAVRRAEGEGEVPRFREAAIRAIAFIVRQQHNDGGWRYSNFANERSDCSVSGWAMLALKTAREAHIVVPEKTLYRTRLYFKSCETSDGRTAYQSGTGPGSDAITAVGMLNYLLLLREPDAPLVKASSSYLAARAENYRALLSMRMAEFYTLYNATLAMYQAGGENWKEWNSAVRDGVIALQIGGEGCERGSWDPDATNGGSMGGRVYSTALATLTLEVYYRFARDHDARMLSSPKESSKSRERP